MIIKEQKEQIDGILIKRIYLDKADIDCLSSAYSWNVNLEYIGNNKKHEDCSRTLLDENGDIKEIRKYYLNYPTDNDR